MKFPTFLLPKAWKGAPFGRSLPVYAIIGSNPPPPGAFTTTTHYL